MPEQIRLLHLENNSADRKLVRSLFTDAGMDLEYTYAQTADQFMHVVASKEWDVILAAYALPSFSGPEELAVAQRLAPQTPFILVSGVVLDDQAVDMLKMGATDYVVKQRLQRLIPAVKRALAETQSRMRLQQTEKALRQSEKYFRLLVDSIRDYAMFMVDSAGVVKKWNAGAQRIFGYSEDEVVQLSIWPLDSRGHSIFQRLSRIALDSGHVEQEVLLHRKDGSPFDASVIMAPLSADVQGYAVITRDITLSK